MNSSKRSFMALLVLVVASVILYGLYSGYSMPAIFNQKFSPTTYPSTGGNFRTVPNVSGVTRNDGGNTRSPKSDVSESDTSSVKNTAGSPPTKEPILIAALRAPNRTENSENSTENSNKSSLAKDVSLQGTTKEVVKVKPTQLPSKNSTSSSSSSSSSSQSSSSSSTSSSLTTNQKPKILPAPDKILCVHFVGRLGNQMFQYASALGLAKRLNRIPVYGESGVLASALKNPPKSSPSLRQRCGRAAYQGEPGCCKFHKMFVELDPSKDYRVGQYLQSWKYFEGAEEDVRKAMQFNDQAQGYADRLLKDMRDKHPKKDLVGVHVRRGDYLIPKHVSMGYRTAPPDYFRRAFDFMRHNLSDVMFVVSTDSEEWFHKEVSNSTDVIVLKRQDAVTDMAVLASLDHVITSVGTYSWWVGYLNRGLTVYWKDFIAVGTAIGSSFYPNGTTFVYPDWVAL